MLLKSALFTLLSICSSWWQKFQNAGWLNCFSDKDPLLSRQHPHPIRHTQSQDWSLSARHIVGS